MFYQHHIFFCNNKRADGTGCGYLVDENESFQVARKYIKDLGISGAGKCRVSKSGCLGRCEDGPICVVYPDAIWYTYVDEADVTEIVDTHLVKGKIVERLKI